jgi:cardiolipin synthase
MSAIEDTPVFHWICTGNDVFPAMLKAIDAARQTVVLETYTFSASPLGERFRDALIRARGRGVTVHVLIDGLGSMGLANAFWDPVREAGGEVRVFNPLTLNRVSIRDHRKLLVCDEQVAFVGGFNIAPEYEGDGVSCGWCDLGLRIEGALASELAASFHVMFARADFRHKRFLRLRQLSARRTTERSNAQILYSGPGRGRNPISRALYRDLARGQDVRIAVAYFLPSWRLRRGLSQVVRRGGQVQLVLAGKSDVLLSQLAGRSLYRRLLKGGIKISEYQPQILHAKLIIVDDIVYVGSSNLDPRSLQINYELMIRVQDSDTAAEAREMFNGHLAHSTPITLDQWRRSRTIWRRLKQRWAYFLLVRVDPYVARWQWRALPD